VQARCGTPPTLLFNAYRQLFRRDKVAHYSPLLRLRISGALTPVPLTPSRHTHLPLTSMSATTPQEVTWHELQQTWCSTDRTKNRWMWVHSTNGRTPECGHTCDRTSCNMWFDSPITSHLHTPSPPDMFPRLLDNVLVAPLCMHCLTHEECIPPDKSASEPDTPYTGHTVFPVSLLH